MKTICKECGKKIKNRQFYCPNCGAQNESGEREKDKSLYKGLRSKAGIFCCAIALLVLVAGLLVFSKYCQHEYTDVSCIQQAACKKCGKVKEDALGHLWSEATCSAPKTCSRCLATEGSALGHSCNNVSCVEGGICTRCGTTIEALGHKWKEATCTTAKECDVCGTKEGKSLGHSGDEVCVRCGFFDKEMAISNAKKAIYVYGIDLDVNSVGGVDTYITWKNMSTKEIKYIYFYVQYYDNVKEVLANEIGGAKTIKLYSTGPFPYGKGNYDYYESSGDRAESVYFTISSGFEKDLQNGWAGMYWEAPFYNMSTKYTKLTKIEIEYMDKSTYIISDPTAIAAIVGNGSHPNSFLVNDSGDNYLR